jgi:hypothetical protein
LDVGKKAPFKPGFQSVFEPQHFHRRPVGSEDDLLTRFVKRVESVKELLLRLNFTRDELNIVNQKKIRLTVFFPEFDIFVCLYGGNQFVCKVVSFDVYDFVCWMGVFDDVPDGVQQMRFSEP